MAPGETAMFCCPLLSSDSPFPSIYLQKVRDAIQIRWQSSDLSVLETHPLTLGLTLNPPAPTLPPLAPLEPAYKIAIGLAFLPLLIAGIAAIWGGLLVHSKRRRHKAKIYTAPSNAAPGYFRPKSLTMPPLILYFGFAISAIILLEISCHTLPSASGPIHFPKLQSRNQVTKVIRTDISLLISILEATPTIDVLHPNVTCGDPSEQQYLLSTIFQENSGIPTTRTRSIPVPTCSVSGIPVEHDCFRPVGAPPGQKWLDPNNTSGQNSSAWKATYFLATIFPTLLATIFAILWKIMNTHATSLEPFHRMSRHNGSPMVGSILRNYEGFNSLRGLLPFLTTCLMYGTSLVAPLASEAWKLGLVGRCASDESRGCSAVLQAVPQVVRTLETALAIIILLMILLAIGSRSWSTGVVADLRSILGIATLCHAPDLLKTIASIPAHMSLKDIRRWARVMTLLLPPTPESGIILSGNPVEHFKFSAKTRRPQNPVSRTITSLVIFACCLTGLDVLIIYYRLTSGDTSFERFMSSQSFVTTLLAPYLTMVPTPRDTNCPKARSSILLPYATDPYTSLLPTILLSKQHKHLFLFSSVTLATILSDFFPLLLSAIPFSRTTTFISHLVCSWLSVAILTFMVIVIIFLIITLKSSSMEILSNEGIDVKLLRNVPIFGILKILSRPGSEGFVTALAMVEGLERMGTGERERLVEGAERRYCLVDGAVQVQDSENLVVERVVVESK
ncbi:hypothetical protein DL95DRAFT_483878 [Leptodontidium sp. 2 PMI_412]|nr:hypothetical protein DL95DRAFT_483878 [Leptodontidium sp. 2 PMI_412]